MRHYVLTRSAFGPAWDLGANRRRLNITRAVTVRLMAAQTTSDWTWVVLLDERDPLLADRLSLYRDSAPAFAPIIWHPPDEPLRRGLERVRQRSAAADYKAPWRRDIPADDTVLLTRIDDDDGFAPDALARYQAAAEGITKRTALMLPMGIRVWKRRYSTVRHERNAMHTLVTPPGDTMCVYDYGHTKVADAAPVVMVDDGPGWLWVRHTDTISGWRRAEASITAEVRGLFPIDWPTLFAAWGKPGPPRRPSPAERAAARRVGRVA